MKRILSIVYILYIYFGVSSSQLTDEEYSTAWSSWKTNYQQSFSSEEDTTRFSNFKSNLDLVHSDTSGNFDLNMYSHMSPQEFQSGYLGAFVPDSAEGLSAGAIAGIVIGSVAALALLAGGGYYLWRRYRKPFVLEEEDNDIKLKTPSPRKPAGAGPNVLSPEPGVFVSITARYPPRKTKS